MGAVSTHQPLNEAAGARRLVRNGAALHEARACPVCHHRSTGEALFCPLDGERLTSSTEYDAALDPLLGTLVDGRYRILDVLGEGGMGCVYRVRHEALGRLFALKALKAELAHDATVSARFIQEARAAARVTHPNVVQIADFGSLPSGQPYFAMELLVGSSLSRLLGVEGPFAVARAVHVACEVAEALGAAHQAGIIHRDLKPDNVYLGPGDAGRITVKVLDFGLAKVAGSSSLTRAGMVFGTPHYMSPEQACGGVIDQRVDIYSLGVVLFEMLTGRVPFEADTYMGVLTQHLYVDPPRLSEAAGEDRFGPLEGIVHRCLAKNPEDRFETMAALASQLHHSSTTRARPVPSLSHATSADSPAGRRAGPDGAAPSILRRWPWIVGAVGLAGLGAATLGWGAGRGDRWSRPGGRAVQSGFSEPGAHEGSSGPSGALSFGERPSTATSTSTSALRDGRGAPGPTDLESRASGPPVDTTSATPTRPRSDSDGRAGRAAITPQRRSLAKNGEIIDPWAPSNEP